MLDTTNELIDRRIEMVQAEQVRAQQVFEQAKRTMAACEGALAQLMALKHELNELHNGEPEPANEPETEGSPHPVPWSEIHG